MNAKELQELNPDLPIVNIGGERRISNPQLSVASESIAGIWNTIITSYSPEDIAKAWSDNGFEPRDIDAIVQAIKNKDILATDVERLLSSLSSKK